MTAIAAIAPRRKSILAVDDDQKTRQLLKQYLEKQQYVVHLAHDGESFPVPPGVNLALNRARIFADPRVDPDGLPPIRLRHPEADATRV